MEDTNDKLVTPKTFNLAKEKGYVHSVLSLYIMPSQSYLQKWLREKHKMIIVIDWEGVDGFFYKLNFDSFYDVSGNNSKSYEDCLEIALYECLQRVSETVA